ncbi:maleylpyruvate isomerase family mycothiol-dependent enzyme [Streptacidiphilus sp. MAP5-3]|uniref:maleylpyruvate isomerase N-terminal domain-containing protein n=1 Tax=unclassified Streptacidiphilus TaxID=2643834 RepID=UPI003514D178
MSIAPTTDIPALAESTARLLATVEAMDEAQLGEPSLLPGWTRGHVLAHLARNADGLLNLLTGARTGETIPMYASPEVRDRDIEAGAKHSLAEHIADLRAGAARFDAGVAAMTDAAWSVTAAHRLGPLPVAEVPAKRRKEVEYHHVDLGLPDRYSPADWPATWVATELSHVAAQFAGNPEVASIALAPVGGEVLTTGRSAATAELTVSGPGHALLAWLTGRSDGSTLAVLGQAGTTALPALPPLG